MMHPDNIESSVERFKVPKESYLESEMSQGDANEVTQGGDRCDSVNDIR